MEKEVFDFVNASSCMEKLAQIVNKQGNLASWADTTAKELHKQVRKTFGVDEAWMVRCVYSREVDPGLSAWAN